MAPDQCSMAGLWEETAEREREGCGGVILCIVCCYSSSPSCQKLRTRAGIKLRLLENVNWIMWDLAAAVAGHWRPPLWGVIPTRSTVLLNIRDGCRPGSFPLRKLAAHPVFFLQKWYLFVCGKGAIKQIVILSLSEESWFKTGIMSVQPCRKGRACRYLYFQLLKDHWKQLRNHKISQNSKLYSLFYFFFSCTLPILSLLPLGYNYSMFS